MFATFDGPTLTHPMMTSTMRNNHTLVVKNEMRTMQEANLSNVAVICSAFLTFLLLYGRENRVFLPQYLRKCSIRAYLGV
jgi:hypothetical protein